MNQNRNSSPGRIKARPEPPTPGTDWVAWGMQFALGLVVGFGVGLKVALLLRRYGSINFGQIFIVAFGVGLGGGGFASYLGDRAWMRPSLFDPPEPPRTETARLWSLSLGSLGGLLVLGAMITQGQASGWPSSGAYSSGLLWFRLLMAAILGLLLYFALRNGTGFWRFGVVNRDDSPLFFWGYVLVLAIALFGLLFRR